MKIPELEAVKSNFFCRSTVEVARDLIDTYLVTNKEGCLCGGRIIETEAYLGHDDKASHASVGLTSRNQLMYGDAAHVYVYLIYGVHYCFNVVTEVMDKPGAVLIRAIEPELGIDEMSRRRGRENIYELASGPGKLTRALNIDILDNGIVLPSENISIFHGKNKTRTIGISRRVGITKSAELPYRFFVKENKFVSVGEII